MSDNIEQQDPGFDFLRLPRELQAKILGQVDDIDTIRAALLVPEVQQSVKEYVCLVTIDVKGDRGVQFFDGLHIAKVVGISDIKGFGHVSPADDNRLILVEVFFEDALSVTTEELAEYFGEEFSDLNEMGRYEKYAHCINDSLQLFNNRACFTVIHCLHTPHPSMRYNQEVVPEEPEHEADISLAMRMLENTSHKSVYVDAEVPSRLLMLTLPPVNTSIANVNKVAISLSDDKPGTDLPKMLTQEYSLGLSCAHRLLPLLQPMIKKATSLLIGPYRGLSWAYEPDDSGLPVFRWLPPGAVVDPEYNTLDLKDVTFSQNLWSLQLDGMSSIENLTIEAGDGNPLRINWNTVPDELHLLDSEEIEPPLISSIRCLKDVDFLLLTFVGLFPEFENVEFTGVKCLSMQGEMIDGIDLFETMEDPEIASGFLELMSVVEELCLSSWSIDILSHIPPQHLGRLKKITLTHCFPTHACEEMAKDLTNRLNPLKCQLTMPHRRKVELPAVEVLVMSIDYSDPVLFLAPCQWSAPKLRLLTVYTQSGLYYKLDTLASFFPALQVLRIKHDKSPNTPFSSTAKRANFEDRNLPRPLHKEPLGTVPVVFPKLKTLEIFTKRNIGDVMGSNISFPELESLEVTTNYVGNAPTQIVVDTTNMKWLKTLTLTAAGNRKQRVVVRGRHDVLEKIVLNQIPTERKRQALALELQGTFDVLKEIVCDNELVNVRKIVTSGAEQFPKVTKVKVPDREKCRVNKSHFPRLDELTDFQKRPMGTSNGDGRPSTRLVVRI